MELANLADHPICPKARQEIVSHGEKSLARKPIWCTRRPICSAVQAHDSANEALCFSTGHKGPRATPFGARTTPFARRSRAFSSANEAFCFKHQPQGLARNPVWDKRRAKHSARHPPDAKRDLGLSAYRDPGLNRSASRWPSSLVITGNGTSAPLAEQCVHGEVQAVMAAMARCNNSLNPTGGSMKVRLNPSLHAIAALTALSSAAYADTTVLLPDCLRCTLDAAPPQGQTWITRGDFVTVGQDGLNAAGTLVNRTVRLDNPRNFTVSGQLQNETLFRNTNQLSVQDGGSVRNTGLIWNEGHVDLNGRFTNLRARVVNEGTFSGAGTFDNAKGSLFTNHGSTSLQAITNQGDIINRGTLASSVLVNHGTLQNTGSFQLAANHDLTGGTLRNTGGGTMLLSSALTLGDPKSGNVVLGQGELRLLNGAVLKNAKGHVQVNAGLIRQWDDLNVTSFVNEGTLVNSGQIVITRDFKNAGTITGKGDYRQRGTFVRGETSGSASFGKVAINGGVFKLLPGGNLQARDVSVNESYFEQSGGTLTTTDRLY
ncbi:MAG: hypothetical protein EOP38_22965, partial [Rubrivivax sp.]